MDLKSKTCCFTGHRRIARKDYGYVYSKLKQILIELINNGYLYFGAGGALGFDTIAAEVILELKITYPQIRLILVLPCKNQTKNWHTEDRKKYEYIKSCCDKYIYTSECYYDGCMLKRNRHLVDNSSVCVCYLVNFYGGTAYTVKYARQIGLQVINVAD